MSAVPPTIICSNPACRYHETGKCVEGFPDRANCPHYQSALASPVASEAKPVADNAPSVGGDFVSVPGGNALSVEEAHAVLVAENTRVIAIVGPTEAGKTSLIARLYDVFQWGPCAGTRFSASRTLSAFENRCHKARAASRRTVGAVDHTPLGQGVRFFHLQVLEEEHPEPVTLLLADRPGEDYRLATDNVAIVRGFAEVQRADVMLLLVDGKRLRDAAERHNLLGETRLLVLSLFEGQALHRATQVIVTLTKYDLIYKDEHESDILAWFERVVAQVKAIATPAGVEVATHRVAAMPETDRIEAGHGIPELLTLLLRPSNGDVAIAQEPELPASVRPFLRLVSISS